MKACILVAVAIVAPSCLAQYESFPDVPENHWVPQTLLKLQQEKAVPLGLHEFFWNGRPPDRMQLAVVPVGFLLGCEPGAHIDVVVHKGPNVDIVVPEGSRGVVKVREVASAPEIALEDGNYTILVPESGVAEVKSLEPFTKSQLTKVSTADGKELNDVAQSGEIPGEVQWWDLGRQASGAGMPAQVELFVGTPDEYGEYVVATASRGRIRVMLASLGNPSDCFGETASVPCRKMFDELKLLSKLDTFELDALYGYFDEKRATEQSNRIDNLLRVLTRITFEVEQMKERKRFSSKLDDGAKPFDWLYPVGISDGRFVLLGTGFQGHSTGVLQGPKAEFDYVVKKVPRRSW